MSTLTFTDEQVTDSGPTLTFTGDKVAPTGLSGLITGQDKYRTAAAVDLNAQELGAAAVPGLQTVHDYGKRLVSGLGVNWKDELDAIVGAPIESIRRGVNPVEGYRYAKARENLALERARERTGLTGTLVEAAGGLASGGRGVLGRAIPAGQAVIQRAPGALARWTGSVGRGAGAGAIAGAGEGDAIGERLQSGLIGGAIGGAVGGALPPLLYGGSLLTRPVTNYVRSLRAQPGTGAQSMDDIALDQVGRAIERSRKTGAEISREVADANASGQPYVLAEGIGLEGQRKLAGLAKTPGEHRQIMDDWLTQRDLGRTDRTRSAISHGLGVDLSRSADEAREILTRRAQAASRPFYQAAEAVRPVWSERMQQFFEHPTFRQALGRGYHAEELEALARGRPFNPRDYAITQFNEAGDPILSAVPNMRSIHLMKRGIDDMLEQHRNPVTGRIDSNNPTVQGLQRAQQAMLREVDALNPAYAQARARYAGPAQVRRAVDFGENIAQNRYDARDMRRQFAGQNAPTQQGTRIGYANRMSRQLGETTETGPLPKALRTPDGIRQLEQLSLYQGPRAPRPVNPLDPPGSPRQYFPDRMGRAIEREKVMRDTLVKARGGSQTMENAADMADSAVPGAQDVAGFVSNLFGGNWGGAARQALPAVGRVLTGDTEAIRMATTRLLMARDPRQVQHILQNVADLQARRRAAAAARARGGGVAVAPDQQRRNR